MTKYIFSINDLILSKNAQFFKIKKALSRNKIINLFRSVSSIKDGVFLIKEIKSEAVVGNESLTYSLVSFKIMEEPSFLQGTSISESKYAYLMILEVQDFLIISKKNVDASESELEKFIEYFEFDKFSNFNGRLNPEYEKISMRNMSLSDSVIRNRTVEAKNLSGILSPNTTGRSIPGAFRVKTGNDIFTLTPNTSRIGYKDKKVDFFNFCSWAIATVNELSNTASLSSKLMAGFSSPITLGELLAKKVKPKAIFIDLSELDDMVRGTSHTLTLTKDTPHGTVTLSSVELDKIFNGFKSSYFLDGETLTNLRFKFKCRLRFNTKVVTIVSKYLDSIMISENGSPLMSLSKYINKFKPFTITFDSPQYCYHGRSCFEDKTMLNNLNIFLSVFDDSFDFSTVRSEKEKDDKQSYPANIKRFPVRSLFRRVENIYSNEGVIVICDDMNDEWADHIVLDIATGNPSIKFIHAKYIKKESYGASKFHEVIGQALKNIGRLHSPKELYLDKYDNEWSSKYLQTQISRVRPIGTSSNDIELALDKINESPKTNRELILAAPFLRKEMLIDEVEIIKKNQSAKPYTVQLIWLINTFLSACIEYGVKPSILCKK
ncbi:hypothetical protein E5C03_07830 [Providencia rettgeri]|uniref:hypothetical protein n=1 Tax=Providencia rettgeri TaxID=587 RepID=UPI001C9A3182|nr:hypothetical protein [Providencia rettgeri]MBY6329042.1 hypothetical protein [Providencia rettgeri]